MFKKQLIFCLSIVFCLAFSSCSKEPSKIVEVDQPFVDDGPGVIKTYSGTYALEAEFNIDKSNCGEDLAVLDVIQDTLNCSQSSEAFSCTSLLSNQSLKGNIKDKTIQIHNDQIDQDFKYIVDDSLGLGEDVKSRQMLLEGSFVNLNTMTNATLSYVEESSKDIFGGRNSCTLVWDAMLVKADDDSSKFAPSPPVISIIKNDADETYTVNLKSSDQDSKTEDLKYLFIHFRGDDALTYIEKDSNGANTVKTDDATIAALDWDNAQEPEHGDHFPVEVSSARDLHVIYAIAIDETGNKSGIGSYMYALNYFKDGAQAMFIEKPIEIMKNEVSKTYSMRQIGERNTDWPELSEKNEDYLKVTDKSELNNLANKDDLLKCFDSDQCDVWKVKYASQEGALYFDIVYMKTKPVIDENHPQYSQIIEYLKAQDIDTEEIKSIVDAEGNIWSGDIIPSCMCNLYRVIFNNNDYDLVPVPQQIEE